MASRDKHPPGGWQVIIPEIGMRKAQVGSFSHCENFVLGVVRGNRHLAQKHGWHASREWVGNYVEQQNVARCLANPAWHGFLMMDAAPAPAPERDIPDGSEGGVKKNEQGSVVGAARNLTSGVRILLDLLGPTGKPVERSLAEARAAICSTCPKNDGGDWKAYFTEPIAEKIGQQLELKHQMKLATPLDDKLTVCSACDCPLPLKVWTPLSFILKHTDASVKEKLDPRCWITHEEPSST